MGLENFRNGICEALVRLNGEQKRIRPRFEVGEVFQLWAVPLLGGAISCALWWGLWELGELSITIRPHCQEDFLFRRIGSPYAAGYVCGALFIVLFLSICLRDYLIFGVRLYQRLSPESVRRRCIFCPSCSQYMILCLSQFGALKGSRMGIKRILWCREEV